MYICIYIYFFFFKQKTAYEIGTGDWSSDVCFRSRKADAIEASGCWMSPQRVLILAMSCWCLDTCVRRRPAMSAFALLCTTSRRRHDSVTTLFCWIVAAWPHPVRLERFCRTTLYRRSTTLRSPPSGTPGWSGCWYTLEFTNRRVTCSLR